MSIHATAPRSRVSRRAGRRRDASGTREALLAAGTELFAERGFHGVPVSAIAEKAAVNKAMISYHFGGKRKLYVAILTATFSEIVAQVERVAESTRPAPQVLRDLIALIGDTATRRHPHFCTMMLREVLTGGKHVEARLFEQPVRVLAAVRRIVERGIRDGDFRPVDPLLTHLSLVGSLVFFFATARFRERMFSEQLHREPPDPGAYVRHIQDLIIEGLATRGPGAARRRHRP